MRDRLIQWWRSGKPTDGGQDNTDLEHSCAGRILNALTFIIIIICLGLWITVFLLLKERLFSETLPGSIETDLTCITFFGGLAMAIFFGALIGNFLRRGFWKILIRKGK